MTKTQARSILRRASADEGEVRDACKALGITLQEGQRSALRALAAEMHEAAHHWPLSEHPAIKVWARRLSALTREA